MGAGGESGRSCGAAGSPSSSAADWCLLCHLLAPWSPTAATGGCCVGRDGGVDTVAGVGSVGGAGRYGGAAAPCAACCAARALPKKICTRQVVGGIGSYLKTTQTSYCCSTGRGGSAEGARKPNNEINTLRSTERQEQKIFLVRINLSSRRQT